MEYRNLGSSGLKVSALGLGGNNFGWWIDEQASSAVIGRAIDLGVNFIDTADMYDKGRSEEFVGKALAGKRHNVLIATKFASPLGEGANDRGGSRYYIMRALEASLRRLNTDYVDLYQMHYPDPSTPIEETLRTLDDLVSAGKVRYIGCSNFAGWQIADAAWTSRASRWASFVTLQSKYNMLERQIEAEVVPSCRAHGLGVIPWGPLAGGILTGKYRRDDKPAAGSGRGRKGLGRLYSAVLTEATWTRLENMESFARARGHGLGDLAIAWLLYQPHVSTVIAGATTPQQVEENVKAAAWKLTPQDIQEVEKL